MKKSAKPDVGRKLNCRWFLADDVRPEQSGKLTLLGLYADNRVVVDMPKDAPAPTIEKPIGIDALTILCTLTGFSGAHDFQLNLSDSTTPEIGLTNTIHVESDAAEGQINLISKFAPCLIHRFGTKRFRISCSDIGFEETFDFIVQRRDVEDCGPRSAVRVSAKAPAPASAKSGGTKKKAR